VWSRLYITQSGQASSSREKRCRRVRSGTLESWPKRGTIFREITMNRSTLMMLCGAGLMGLPRSYSRTTSGYIRECAHWRDVAVTRMVSNANQKPKRSRSSSRARTEVRARQEDGDKKPSARETRIGVIGSKLPTGRMDGKSDYRIAARAPREETKTGSGAKEKVRAEVGRYRTTRGAGSDARAARRLRVQTWASHLDTGVCAGGRME